MSGSQLHMGDTLRGDDRAPIELGDAVADGVFYRMHSIPAAPSRWAKTSVPARIKRYPFGVTVTYPMKLYTLIKYGVRDMMQYEWSVARTLPAEVQPYLLQNRVLRQTRSGECVLCADKVFDFNGGISQTLNQVGRVSNPMFWKHVQTLSDAFDRHGIHVLGVFHGGNHILVHKVSPDDWRPVIVDVVKVGRAMYPFQMNLLFSSAIRRKFYRQLHRFRARFMPVNNC